MKSNYKFLSCLIILTVIVNALKAQSNLISTFAGTGTAGLYGDGGPATLAKINGPNAVMVDPSGNVFISDAGNNRIRMVSPAGIITEIAGNGTATWAGDGGPATAASLNNPSGFAMDIRGNLYVGDQYNQVIRKISPAVNGIITTIAGTHGVSGFSGDGGPATAATFYRPYQLSFDSYGNLYIVDQYNHCVRKITAHTDTIALSDDITTFAGHGGVLGSTGDGGPATLAYLCRPNCVYVDPYNNVFISDNGNQKIRKVNTSNIITTVAGTGSIGSSGDGGPATNAEMDYPAGMKTDQLGNFYFCDADGNRIRKVNSLGIISTICGSTLGTAGSSGDGIPATAALINEPLDVAIDHKGDILFADYNNNKIRLIESGVGIPTFVNGHAQSLNVCENSSAVPINSLLAVSDTDHSLTETWTLRSGPYNGTAVVSYSVTSTGGTLTPAGLYYIPNTNYSGPDSFKVWVNNGYSLDSTTITVNVKSFYAGLITPEPVTVCPGNTVQLTDDTTGGSWGSRSSSIASVSGTGLVTGVSAGNVVISYSVSNSCGNTTALAEVRVGNPIITTFAGTGTAGYTGDGFAATTAELNNPHGLSIDPTTGYIYIDDDYNSAIRKVDPSTGIISTVAGDGASGYIGEGIATAVELNEPFEVLADGSGNIYISDASNNRVRKVNSSGIISTIAGTGVPGSTGDGGPATNAELNTPAGIAFDAAGNLYIGEISNNKVRIVSPAGIINTYAGTGTSGFSGDNGPATAATMHNCNYVHIDPSGNLIITDNGNHRLRKVNSSGIITTIVGTGALGDAGDNGPASAASLDYPGGVSFDGAGNMYIATDVGDGVRLVNTSGIITTVAGTGTAGYSGDGGPPTAATLHTTVDVTLDAAGNLFIADQQNNVVRKVITTTPSVAAITGGNSLCVGAIGQLADATTAGAWSSSNTSVVIVGPGTGVLFGVMAGTATISYSVVYSCGTMVATQTVTVNTTPAAISPATASVCQNSTVTLADGTTGGTWSSSSPGTGSVSGGVVTGITIGTTTITYAIGTCIATAAVTVNAIPSPISGANNECIGASTILADGTTGGTWGTSSSTVTAVTGATVTGVSEGIATISYTLSTGCYSTLSFTVDPLPGAITGVETVCAGSMTTLSDLPGGGTWTSGNGAVATVGSGSGTVTGVAGGTATITYSLGTGCIATAVVTVNNTPAAISGANSVCVGSSALLTDGTGGGAWGTSNGAVATVAGGTVTGVGTGTATISYTLSTGCYSALSFTVNAVPGAITGVKSVCAGSTTTLSDLPGGGVWTTSNGLVATVGSGSGSVTGVTAGTATLTYTISSGCFATAIVTVNATPAAISGANNECVGSSTILTDGTSGGAWGTSNGAVATVAGGTVTGVGAGTATISYTLSSTGCYSTLSFTVNAIPGAITGVKSVCAGSTTALSDLPGGGNWSTSNGSVATVGSGSGSVTGVTAGTATISYTIGTGCFATAIVTVNATPAAISGANNVCAGSTAVLTDGTTGGAWATSNGAVASVAGGTVTGVGAGTATISYTLSSGCYSTLSFTVNPVPGAITGAASVCAGSTALLHDATSGGTWLSSNSSVASVGSGSGTVSGVIAGTAIITYEIGAGCQVTTVVTVNPLPAAITGATTLCSGGSATLGDVTIPGTWSSSNSTVAGIVAGTGFVTAVMAGTATISYTLGTGCYQTTLFTVNSAPSGITGSTSVCIGATANLGDAVTGGTWSSSNVAVGSIGPVSGTVTGVSAGTTVITYNLGLGCIATTTVAVNSVPNPISPSGGVSVCPGNTTIFTDATIGGTWTSSNTGIATVGASSGVVTGVNAGTVTISYSNSLGCPALKTVTVNIAPHAITPSSPLVCVGGVTDLADAVGGGIWSSNNLGLATVGSLSGIVSGVATGTTLITYSIGTCYTTIPVTVSGILSAGVISGPSAMCVTTPVTLTDAAGGGVWSSGNTSVVTIGSSSGIVSGVGAGTVIITYSVTNSCGTALATTTVDVSVLGAGSITGAATVCAGTFSSYTDAVSGGAWSLSNTSASITGGGLVTGVTPGTDIITYTVTNTCGISTTTKTITIGAYLTAGSITGPSTVCAGSSVTLTDLAPSGIWSSGNANATVSGGMATGVTAGVDTITYTVTSVCGSAYAVHTLTVIPVPVAGSITGPASICLGTPVSYSDVATGGVWSMRNATATVSGAGLVTPVTAGTNVISYSVTSSCGTATATETINIGALLTAGTITGPSSVCAGAAITLTDAVTGGVWSASNADATVSGGSVTGVSAGTVTISYTETGSCGSVSATYPVTVIPIPVAGTITGPSNICTGITGTYTDAATGGVWALANATASISGSGIVTPVSTGTNIVSYMVTNACGSALATETITIGTGPSAGTIAGPGFVCTGTPITLTDGAAGGVWSASNPDASVSGGVVTGLTAGLDTISYSVTNSCGTAATTQLVTVNLAPNAGSITGPAGLCSGTPITYTDGGMSGGVWSVSNTTASVSGSGLVTPVSAGTNIISYTVTNVCGTAVASKTVSINTSVTSGAITGPGSICIGSSVAFTDAAAGGAWSSANAAVATVGSGTGLVSGLSIGTTIISYTVTNSCGTAVSTATVSSGIAPYAGIITGLSTICAGSGTTYADAAAGGVWAVSNSSGTISTGGVFAALTPLSADTIIYTVTNTCGTATATKTVSIGAEITTGSISGAGGVCAGSTTTLSDPAGGGSWFSSSTAIATVDASSGLVAGLSAGTTIISYSVTLSCGTAAATSVFAVNSAPSAGTITGPSAVCDGSAITLADVTSGGVWGSSNTNASVSGGIVTGLAAGLDTINYTVTNYCGTASVTKAIEIDVFPGAGVISGPPGVCPGANITLTDGVPGGVWSAGNINAYIGSASGIVTGITSGTDDISYTVTNSCGTASTGMILVINSVPSADSITGPAGVCAGSTITLADPASGGVWSVSNASASVSGSGAVTGILAGTDEVTYTVTNACGTAYAMKTITISTTAYAGVISGLSAVCAGSGITLTETVPGGTWISGNANASVVGPGIIDGITVGMDTIFYAVSGACGTSTTSKILAINPVPVVSPVTGPVNECPGTSITMTDAVPDGIWTSSNTSVATVGLSSGIVTGVAAGTTSITYTVTNSYGCPTSVMMIDTVDIAPVTPAITGSDNVCAGSSVTLADADAGGVWSSGDPSVATVDPSSGSVTGAGAGTATISYSLVSVCGVSTVITTEVVSLPPSVPAITGAGTICAGTSETLSDAVSGGVWSSSAISIATVGALTGIVAGVSGGMDVIDYTITNACGSAVATASVNISPLPDPGVISGTPAVCMGADITLTDPVPGGVWSAGNSNATVSAGVVTGVTGGTDPVSYSVTNGCGTSSAILTITINSFPLVDSVLGASGVCGGATIALTDATPGGTWSSSNSDADVAGGTVTGISAGTDTIIYTVSNACATVAAIRIITIHGAPYPGTISGPSDICTGATATLTDSVAGGVWSSSNTLATVTGGLVDGITAGADTIYYSVTNACGTTRATQIITITSIDAGAITGLSGVCVGSTLSLADAAGGGIWSSSSADATVSGGIVTGISSGIDTIAYTVTNRCGTAVAQKVISVNTLAGAGTITGASVVCVGASVTLADVITGGVWASSDTKATVSPGGVVTGISAGADTIMYSASNGCGAATATKVITIGTTPYAGSISGISSVCPGITITLSDGTLGGVWSSGNTSIATVSGGVVTGVSSGVDDISYTVSNSCGSAAATYSITVLTPEACNTGVGNVANGSADELKVYPNPNPGAFTMGLMSDNNEPVHVIITNVLGMKVQEFITSTNKQTDVQLAQAAGIYLLTATTAHGKYVAKITVE